MGKKQHQKDKLYLTTTEWSTLYGGYRPPQGEDKEFRRLPFTHCALSLQPFEQPLCTPRGHVYDLMHIVPFIKRHKIDPVTGKKLDIKSLLKLHFHKNSDGEYQCPVLFKVFTQNSHIVAIRTTGNVMSFEAVDQLNLKARNMRELLTDEEFTRSDIITIQDPQNLEKFNLSAFHHIKNNIKVTEDERAGDAIDPQRRLKSINSETKAILEQLNHDFPSSTTTTSSSTTTTTTVKADKFNSAHFSTGRVAAGFTSTVMEPVVEHEASIIDEDSVRYKYVKKNGYVRLVTNAGSLNFELYCPQTPKTCENFIKHCQNGYYNGTKFHRLLRNFMVQGGDPTATGSGGQSIWGRPFSNECRASLTHSGRGILSMANSGSDKQQQPSNGSQFFITFRSCRHLDGQHSVFGRLVGGMDTLNTIERVETDNKDRPIDDIVVERAVVFVDPFQQADEELAALRAEEEKDGTASTAVAQTADGRTARAKLKPLHSGVGKYIQQQQQNLGRPASSSNEISDSAEPVTKKVKKAQVGYSFGSFSSW